MSTPMKAAFVCHLLATLLIAAFGLTYILKTEFMPYHAVALGMSWGEVSLPFQVLILALMSAVGSAALAVVVLELFLLFGPFMQRVTWARVAIPVGGLVISSGALYAMVYVSLHTPATPPWIASVVGALLLVIGLVLSLVPPKSVDVGASHVAQRAPTPAGLRPRRGGRYSAHHEL